jgi:methylglutaconyl-CoA hydratase
MANVEFLTYDIKACALWIGLNRVDKRNAFNDALIAELEQVILAGLDNPEIKAFCLYAHGNVFSAGADLEWMLAAQTMNEAQNIAQAKRLADVLYLWHQSPKPTLCLVQGNAYGGALGFMAASDYCLAQTDTHYCFSEVKLGLIPAIISPYILKAIGLKKTKQLFLSAENIDANQALSYGLIDEIRDQQSLVLRATTILARWVSQPTTALQAIKPWLESIQYQTITAELIAKTAQKLAKMRSNTEAKERLNAFLAQKQGKRDV